jgi:hypothetical protein
MEITNMAFIAGLILGSLAILSVCWVWLRKQVLGVGGGVLSFIGVLLVGLSLWSSASVEVSPDGFRAEFERLEQQVIQVSERSQQISNDILAVAETNKAISQEVKVVAQNIDINKAQFLKLTDVLQRRQTLSADQVNAIDEPVRRAPIVNLQVLDSAIINTRPRGQ